MELNDIFENLIKIEPKVVSIETLFNNEETLRNTKYDPDYQRNYVWDDEKATYFIESILLGTEIPPIIYFRNGDNIEIIDGRQRYQTVLRFLHNEFKLKNSGLHKLEVIKIGGKSFKDLDELKDVFWDTKLRIIEFSFHSKKSSTEELEDKIKKEIFKRYNSGITPLKPTEIDKAYYFEDDLNTYFENKLTKDKVLFEEVSELFYFERSNIQILLKKIRQLLVQHQIPIKYYAIKKNSVITQYYEILSSQLDEESNIEDVFSKFILKINVLKRIKKDLAKFEGVVYNRLISECLFWAFSIIETEIADFSYKSIDKEFIHRLTSYINENIATYGMDRSSFSKEIQTRYSVTARFFGDMYNISFENYIQTSQEFKDETKKTVDNKPQTIKETSFDDLRINKPEPSSITIVDICRQMEKNRFLIRPPYQRSEVINKSKSSAIIESILLGIKLPPIFVFKREDGVSEVLDGQQRLLSILGFLKRKYTDENNVQQQSVKNGYSLSLKNGILSDLDGKNVDTLAPEMVKKINNFDLWIIEINHRYNKDFEPIDLFLRLNSKPYPIKENTFEMWNSYIDKDIITSVKNILKENVEWFYFRKNNSRMENENIYTALIYLMFESKRSNLEPLEYYKIGNKINFRIKSKTEITKILEATPHKEEFLQACSDFNTLFIAKLKKIVGDDASSSEILNNNLEKVLNISTTGRRTQQSFYALWYFLNKISISSIGNDREEIRNDLKNLFFSMNDVKKKEDFSDLIEVFWKKYK
jgi:uncharacterized protein with ParB-like and HNH nuclease domain